MANTIYGDGDRLAGVSVADGTRSKIIPQVTLTDATGAPVVIGGGGTPTNPTVTTSGPLTAGVDRSGTATTTSQVLIAANTARVGLSIQNIGTNNLGIKEVGTTAAIGTAGTYTLQTGGIFKASTTNGISIIAATSSTPFTATEW